MKSILRLAAATMLASAPSNAAPPVPPAGLCVTTYNLRYASNTPPNAWPVRRPVLRACIGEIQPDLLGTQEGTFPQIRDLAEDLPDYDWIGTGREGGSRGEFMAVFYRKERFEPLAYDHFWLSDRPDQIGSTSWGNRIPRMVTWVRFHDKVSGVEFYFWNTHFDHESQAAREKSAALIRDSVTSLDPTIPVILVGDFNATAGRNPAYDLLVKDGPFVDAWELAEHREGGNLNTFNGFRPVPPADDDRIDWILVRGIDEVERIQIVDYREEGQYPSDHFPVAAYLDLNNP